MSEATIQAQGPVDVNVGRNPGGCPSCTDKGCEVRCNTDTSLCPSHSALADADPQYRLLVSGDIVVRGDEWLQDDAETWEPTPAWAVGMRYAPGPAMLPARRKVTPNA